MKIIRTREAKEDIKEIYKYSFSTFGEMQAEKYFEGLEEVFYKISSGDLLHYVLCSDLVDGMKRTQYKKHFIYYQELEDAILIARVLHQSTDEPKHFS